VRAKLERLYPKLTISQSSQAANQQQMVTYMQGFAWGIALLAVIIGGIGMMNTVMMSAFERTREIGTLRALGWSRQRVTVMVLGESVSLGVIGGALGCALGAALIAPMSQSAALAAFMQGRVTLPLLAQGMVTAMVLGGVGGLYPAWWASKLLPVEALRYEGGAGAGRKSQFSNVKFQIGVRKSETLRSLWSRRGRTAMTVTGVSIGLMAVVALSGMADGMGREITKMFGAGEVDLMVRQAGSSDLAYSAINERVGADRGDVRRGECVRHGRQRGDDGQQRCTVPLHPGIRSPGAILPEALQNHRRARAVGQPRTAPGPPGGRRAQGACGRHGAVGRDGLSPGGPL
jgi:hypothetical protein